MRYKLERNKNGMITQCEQNADGTIYNQREELQAKALKNLERATPGKLGNLSNLQYFNFRISNIESGVTNNFIDRRYNTSSTYPANATQTIMFGVDSISDKALYYNVVSLNASYTTALLTTRAAELETPSHVSFYLLQNIPTSTTSLGTKIPQPAPLSGNGGGAVSFLTSGDDYGAQSITIDLVSDSGKYAQNNDTKGIRCSGLALRTILMNFTTDIVLDDVTIDITVGVDVSSVSTTY